MHPIRLALGAALLLIGVAVASARGASEESSTAFFERLAALCGTSYEGVSSFPTEGPFVGKALVATVTTCDEREIRVPFTVGDDRSRTWIISRHEDGLLLKHQHLHDDGTPDEVTDYGGWATAGGSRLSQSFAADAHTRELIPEAATNVWSLTLSADGSELTYALERHEAPRFRAVLRRSPVTEP